MCFQVLFFSWTQKLQTYFVKTRVNIKYFITALTLIFIDKSVYKEKKLLQAAQHNTELR